MATNRTQAERGKFLNADTWDKLTSNIEKGFNEFRGNSDNKLIQILAKYQESKLGQAHTKAGKATSDILFKNPYEFGQQMTNDISDIFGMNNPNYQMRNAPGTGWGNVGKQLGRTLSTGSFIAGTGNPLGAAVYTGISGGVGYLGNRVAGQSHKSAMSNVLPNMLESVPRGFQIAGISSLTNPWIDKAGLAGKGYWGRNLIKSPLNVVQGLAMDQATGSKTTAQSVALDALFPFAQESLGSAIKGLKKGKDVVDIKKPEIVLDKDIQLKKGVGGDAPNINRMAWGEHYTDDINLAKEYGTVIDGDTLKKGTKVANLDYYKAKYAQGGELADPKIISQDLLDQGYTYAKGTLPTGQAEFVKLQGSRQGWDGMSDWMPGEPIAIKGKFAVLDELDEMGEATGKFTLAEENKGVIKTFNSINDAQKYGDTLINKVGGDNYYYHGTPTKNIKSIQQGGLKVGNSGAVALTKEGEESALSWAKTLYKGQDVTSVRVSKDAVNNKFLEDVDAIYSKDDIPPEMLEIKVNGKWKPLVENKEIVRDVNMDKAQEWLNRPNKTPIIKEGQGETGKYFTNVKKSSMSYPYKDYRKYSSEELTDLIKKYENVYYDTTAKVIRKKGTGEPILGRLPQKQIDSLISQGFIKIGKK